MSFWFVPKSVTLNDLEREMACILRYYTDLGRFRGVFRKKVVKDKRKHSATEM